MVSRRAFIRLKHAQRRTGAAGPRLTADPTQGGSSIVGQSSTFTVGTWDVTGSATYAWFIESGGVTVASGTGTTVTPYVNAASDDTLLVRMRLTVTDITGSTTVYTAGAIITAPAITASGTIPALVFPVGVASSVFDLTPYFAGVGIRTYSVVSGALPAGISLNAATGELSGTATTQTASASITFRVVNSGGGANQVTTVEATSAPTGANVALGFDVPRGVISTADTTLITSDSTSVTADKG